MIENEGMVTISNERYQELLEAEFWTECLSAAGVDNWDGYEYAQEAFDEAYGEEE